MSLRRHGEQYAVAKADEGVAVGLSKETLQASVPGNCSEAPGTGPGVEVFHPPEIAV
jgi:hypothetical protein